MPFLLALLPAAVWRWLAAALVLFAFAAYVVHSIRQSERDRIAAEASDKDRKALTNAIDAQNRLDSSLRRNPDGLRDDDGFRRKD